MAYRVETSELKEIIETSLSDAVLETFIKAANLIVTEHLGSNSTLSDEQRKEIERWLAAHFLACTREQQAQREGVDKADIVYQGRTGMGLDSTYYGQMAKLLDVTGILAGIVGRRKAILYAVTSFD